MYCTHQGLSVNKVTRAPQCAARLLYNVVNNEVQFILYITVLFNILQAFNICLMKGGVDAFAHRLVHRYFKSIRDKLSYTLPKKPALLRVSEVNTTDLSDLEISPFRSAALIFLCFRWKCI